MATNYYDLEALAEFQMIEYKAMRGMPDCLQHLKSLVKLLAVTLRR